MSTILVATLKIAFLVLMWLFILFVTNVIRVDLFGRRVTAEELVAADEQASSLSTGSLQKSFRGRRAARAGAAPPPAPTTVTITTGRFS